MDLLSSEQAPHLAQSAFLLTKFVPKVHKKHLVFVCWLIVSLSRCPHGVVFWCGPLVISYGIDSIDPLAHLVHNKQAWLRSLVPENQSLELLKTYLLGVAFINQACNDFFL